MSLYEKRSPSLKDKLMGLAKEDEKLEKEESGRVPIKDKKKGKKK